MGQEGFIGQEGCASRSWGHGPRAAQNLRLRPLKTRPLFLLWIIAARAWQFFWGGTLASQRLACRTQPALPVFPAGPAAMVRSRPVSRSSLAPAREESPGAGSALLPGNERPRQDPRPAAQWRAGHRRTVSGGSTFRYCAKERSRRRRKGKSRYPQRPLAPCGRFYGHRLPPLLEARS